MGIDVRVCLMAVMSQTSLPLFLFFFLEWRQLVWHLSVSLLSVPRKQINKVVGCWKDQIVHTDWQEKNKTGKCAICNFDMSLRKHTYSSCLLQERWFSARKKTFPLCVINSTEWSRPLMAFSAREIKVLLDRRIFSFLWKMSWLNAAQRDWDVRKELNTGHSEVEALERLETHHPLNNHHRPLLFHFVPVNMLYYLWKGHRPEIILWNNDSIFNK